MFYKRILVLCITMLLVLTGCNAPVYRQTESNVADAKTQIDDARQKMDQKLKPQPALVVNQGLYVDQTPISLARDPKWLKNRIILRGDELPFSYYSRTIVGGGGKNILTHYQNGLNQSTQIAMNYTGTVKGALDLLAAKTGYVYSINGNDVYWQAFVTKTFDIAFMPGSSDYMMGKTGGGSGGASPVSTSSSSGGSSSSQTVTGTIDDSSGSEYSSFKGTVSVWQDLSDSIKNLLSPDGKVMVSQATTSVTVRDRPSNVALIGRFIKNLNSSLSKQVLVKIDVIQIALESDFNFGINWDIVQQAFSGGQYQLIANNGAPISLSSTVGLNIASATSVGVNNTALTSGARGTGVLALINALKQQGKVSVVTQPQVLCQNNQVSAVRLLDQQGYLASVQTTSLSGSSTGGASITSQITPGAVLTGFTLYVLPKIMGSKVYLQVNADLSTNLGISTITSNGASLTPGTTPPAGTSIIQVPHVQQKQFNQRSVISTGDTLILSGFKQVNNETGASQLLDSQALGGRTSQQVNSEVVVLITPFILTGRV